MLDVPLGWRLLLLFALECFAESLSCCGYCNIVWWWVRCFIDAGGKGFAFIIDCNITNSWFVSISFVNSCPFYLFPTIIHRTPTPTFGFIVTCILHATHSSSELQLGFEFDLQFLADVPWAPAIPLFVVEASFASCLFE
jgi:hypothetical protein